MRYDLSIIANLKRTNTSSLLRPNLYSTNNLNLVEKQNLNQIALVITVKVSDTQNLTVTAVKFLYLNKSQGYILATLLSLIFLGSCYFFVYLPANERKVEEQRFRTLQNIDRNIHDKIENSSVLLKNLLNADTFPNKEYLKDYIANYPTEKFLLTGIDELPLKVKELNEALKDPVNTVVNNATRQLIITQSKGDTATVYNKRDTTKTKLLQVSVKYSFDQFITSLLPDAVFDEYIVFSKDNIVYESFPTGISRVREDSLLNTSNGINGSYVKDMTAGGKNYKLFLQAITFDSTHKWILGGLLSKGRYVKERSQLPFSLILLMITIMVGIVVVFPWIKLYQMGSKDRITIADGISTIVAAMLLMSLLFFCFFKYNDDVRDNNISTSKKVLAAQIEDSFYNETKKHHKILQEFDDLQHQQNIGSIVNLNSNKISKDISVVSKTNGTANIQLSASVKDSLNQYKDSAIINQVFWLDSSGRENYNWTTDGRNAPRNNFSNRKYFQRIINTGAFYIDSDTSRPYFLDQVVSRTSGTFTSIISIPSADKSSKVAAMSFIMQSVRDVVMPTGYSFAVVDNTGKVLYHSLASRNLNENIKSEFSDSASVVNCLSSHSATEFNTLYYNKRYYVQMNPFKNLPYFILVFSDTSYNATRDVEIYSFTFSILLLFFVYMIAQLFVTFLASSRRSFFKKQLFDTSWIGPKLAFHREYVLAAAVNLVIIIVLIVFFNFFSFFQYLFLLLFSVTLIFIFTNTLFANRYLKDGQKNKWRYKQIAVNWLLVILLLINVAGYLLVNDFWAIFLIELGIALSGFGFIGFANKLSHDFREMISPKLNYVRSFALMTVTSLIITSGLPIAFFYRTSYNFEQNLDIRYRQNDYANRLINQPNSVYYFDSTWVAAKPVIIQKDSINFQEKNQDEHERTQKVLGAFHLVLNERIGNTNNLYKSYSTDSAIIYQPLINSDSAVLAYRQTNTAGKFIKIASTNTVYTIPAPTKKPIALLYWSLLVLGLVVFYFVIINIVKKVFCLNLPNLEMWKDLDDKMLEDNDLNKFLLIVGLPGARKFKYIIDQIKDKKIQKDGESLIYEEGKDDTNNVYIADLINIPTDITDVSDVKNSDWQKLMTDVVKEKYKMVVINHFEYNMHCEVANIAKLKLIEQLMVKSKCKIIILSTLHPLAFLDSLNEQVKKADDAPKSPPDIDRWHVLLGHFRISIIPITQQKTKYDPAWHQLLYSETEYTHFLQDMQQLTQDISTGVTEEEAVAKGDQLAYKLQVTAQYFYLYIWQSLTKEEKFLLYDLAEDNLVNSYDDYNLTMLIAKGVIIQTNGLLRLFNRGFRNFILTAIGNSEAMKIKARIRESGNWNNLKTPLVLIILSILAFLLISQQEAYSKLLSYVAALTAGVPAILKIFSLFDKRTAKSNN